MMTEAGFEYFREMLNIASFIVFLLGLVDRADRTVTIAAKALLRVEQEPEKRARLQLAIDQEPQVRKRLHDFDPMLWQMLYARSIDNYLNYLSALLSQVFSTQPGTLMSKDTESVAYVLQFADRTELVSALTEKRVARLAFMSLEELHEELSQKRLFKLFTSTAEKKKISGYGLVRNLIVHNRGRVNRRYRDRIGDPLLILGNPLDIRGSRVLNDSDVLTRSVKRLDADVSAKFKLDRPRARDDVLKAPDQPASHPAPPPTTPSKPKHSRPRQGSNRSPQRQKGR